MVFFFVLIAQVSPGKLFSPLVIAKGASLGLALIIVTVKKEDILPLSSNPAALLAGILDAGGNTFYLLATHFTRLDVAAVLSSFYPAGTVLLTSLVIHEKVSKSQWLGVIFCLASVSLILSA